MDGEGSKSVSREGWVLGLEERRNIEVVKMLIFRFERRNNIISNYYFLSIYIVLGIRLRGF